MEPKNHIHIYTFSGIGTTVADQTFGEETFGHHMVMTAISNILVRSVFLKSETFWKDISTICINMNVNSFTPSYPKPQFPMEADKVSHTKSEIKEDLEYWRKKLVHFEKLVILKVSRLQNC
jgi:hypothetical protein